MAVALTGGTTVAGVTSPADGERAGADLTLMRHGESTWNSTRRVQGQNDEAELTGRGRDQVRAALAALAGSVELIVSSDLVRAVQSAEIAAEVLGLPFVLDADLRERSYGVLEGGPLAAVTPEVVGLADGVVVDEDARPDGGESLRDLVERCARAARRAADRGWGRRTLVVTHGGPIRAIRASLEGRALLGRAWDEVANASCWDVHVARLSGPLSPRR